MKKLTLIIFLVVFFVIFFTAAIRAQTVYVELDVRLIPPLSVPIAGLKEDLAAGIEKAFSDRDILVTTDESQADFKLSGTIEVKHFIQSSDSYSILIKAKHFKIVSIELQEFLPPLAFNPFTSRDRSGGVSPAEDLDDALDYAMEDLFFMMDKNGIFDFLDHPVFAYTLEDIEPEAIERLKTKAELDKMADRIIAKVTAALEAVINAKLQDLPKQLPQPDYSKILDQILSEIKKLKQQGGASPNTADLVTMKKDMVKIMEVLDKLYNVNMASIIIDIVPLSVQLPNTSTFPAIIKPDGVCRECDDPKITAKHIGRLEKPADFDKLALEKTYHIPYLMKGKLARENGQWVIVLAVKDYKKIFEIDRNGRLAPNQLLQSVTGNNRMFPRILVKTYK